MTQMARQNSQTSHTYYWIQMWFQLLIDVETCFCINTEILWIQ
jgi:hypothetical protein